LDAYIFVTDASSQAVSDALALVPSTARAVLPVGTARELYVAVSDSTATGLLTKIADVVTIPGLSGTEVQLAYGSGTTEAMFPTYGVVDDYVGFALLTTSVTTTVSVYEAALDVTGVIGVAIVAGTVNVLVEATAATLNALNAILATVTALTGVSSSITVTGPVTAGAGFTTA
jgi:hypothetical protein